MANVCPIGIHTPFISSIFAPQILMGQIQEECDLPINTNDKIVHPLFRLDGSKHFQKQSLNLTLPIIANDN